MKGILQRKLTNSNHRIPPVPGIVDPVESPDDSTYKGECHAERIGELQAEWSAFRGDDQNSAITDHQGQPLLPADFLFQQGTDSRKA